MHSFLMSGANDRHALIGGASDRNLTSLRRHAVFGIVVMAALIFGLGGWSATTQLEGAIIANGAVVAEGGSRKVQHPEGGIVREILVRNNQHVESGQLLVALDDVSVRAELEVVLSQLREGLGAKARLTAESSGASALQVPEIAEKWPLDPKLSVVLGEQQSLRLSRTKSLDSEVARLNELIGEKRSVIEGYKAQLEAYSIQMNLVHDEVTQQADLFSKELVSNQRLNEMRRNEAELSGQVLNVRASIAATEASISELRMQSDQVVTDFRAKSLAELQTVSQTVAELMQKMIAAEARLSRLEIRAPIAGTVHESIVQTVGGVVSPADTLMLIVPQETHLMVDMRVSPLEVSKLHVGQSAQVRMLNFDARTTPNLEGRVDSISPDLVRDPATGVQYYSVRVDVADMERKKLPDEAVLVPGMPAEGFFQTGERTVLSYLMAPIEQRLSHTFRE